MSAEGYEIFVSQTEEKKNMKGLQRKKKTFKKFPYGRYATDPIF